MNITFRQLRVFAEVARHLSFARAAQALHLTPPAVTMQVKEIESRAQKKVDAAADEARKGAPARVGDIERQVWSDGGSAWRN